MKKILLTLIFVMFLFSFVGATIQTLGTFKLKEDINLIQTCASCSFNNITSILHPNSSQIVGNYAMTKTGSVYNFTLTSGNLTKSGEYIVNGVGDLDGVNTIWSYNFFVTGSGIKLNTSGAIAYLVLLIGVFFIFFLTLWGAIVLPIKNRRNGLDEVIDVDYLKYAKVIFMFLSYTLLVWIVNLLLTLSNSFIILSQYEGFFTMVFQILRALIWPIFVIMIVVFFLLGARDLKLNKLLTRGFRIR